MPTRAQSQEALERHILGMDEGASAPAFRGRQVRTFEDAEEVDNSRVKVARESTGGDHTAPAISVIHVESGLVETRWGPVTLSAADRQSVARLVVSAVRRSWEAELSLLAGETPPPTPTGPVRKDGKPYKKRTPRKKGAPSGEVRSADE